MTPGRVIGLSREKAIVLRQYRRRGQAHAMLTVLRSRGRIVEYPAASVTEVFDQLLDIVETRSFPWCSTRSLDHAIQELDELPIRLRHLPIRVEGDTSEAPILTETLRDEFPCPACPSQHACRKDHSQALRLRQENHRLTKTIHTLRTELWHRFQQHIEILQKFGYLTGTSQLTSNGEWARLIRINHSLLITELIRMNAFTGIEPAILTGVLASIAHDDDRPGAFPRRSSALGNVLRQIRTVAHSLEAYEDPPLLRSDIAAVAELWVAEPHLPWSQLILKTTKAEGDIYRLLARTLEYLSQLYSLKATHPGLADIADQAMEIMRRDVLEELP